MSNVPTLDYNKWRATFDTFIRIKFFYYNNDVIVNEYENSFRKMTEQDTDEYHHSDNDYNYYIKLSTLGAQAEYDTQDPFQFTVNMVDLHAINGYDTVFSVVVRQISSRPIVYNLWSGISAESKSGKNVISTTFNEKRTRSESRAFYLFYEMLYSYILHSTRYSKLSHSNLDYVKTNPRIFDDMSLMFSSTTIAQFAAGMTFGLFDKINSENANCMLPNHSDGFESIPYAFRVFWVE